MDNVVFIVLDTCRKDALSCYEGFADTPNIDAIASDADVLGDVYATSCWTLPSHASMFTGEMPHAIGVRGKSNDIRGERTVIEDLRDNGYTTIGLSNMPLVSERYGFDQGFDIFRYVPNVPFPENEFYYEFREKNLRGEFGSMREKITGLIKNGDLKGLINIARFKVEQRFGKYLWMFDQGAAATNRLLDRYLRETEGPRFIFINYREAHSPYMLAMEHVRKYGLRRTLREANEYPVNYFLRSASPPDADLLHDLYRHDVEYLDTKIGELFGILEEHGILDESKILIISDHGENLGEDGKWSHANDLSDRLINVPFIASGFDLEGFNSLRQIPALLRGDELEEGPAFSEYDTEAALAGKEITTYDKEFWSRTLQSVRTEEGFLIRGSDGSEEYSDDTDLEDMHMLLDRELGSLETEELDI